MAAERKRARRAHGSDRVSTRSEHMKTDLANYARGVVGGMLLGVPVLLTMEMWAEGFTVPAARLLLAFISNFGVLLVLQHFSGLHHRKSIAGEIRAAITASGIGVLVSTVILAGFGVLIPGLTLRDLVGKLAFESIAVSVGASVAMSEVGEGHDVAEERRKNVGYWGHLGMALAGATLFGFGIASTEEPVMISMQISWRQAMLLMFVSIVQVLAIVYVVDFHHRERRESLREHWHLLLRDGVSTYALAIAAAAYFLWIFGSLTGDTGLVRAVFLLIATGFFTSLGAAAGELLI